MRFSIKVKIFISFCLYFSLIINITFSQTTISARKNQIKSREALLDNQIENEKMKSIDNASLNDYINLGLKKNPSLKAAFFEWKYSFSKISEDFSLPDPNISYSEYINEVETRVGPQKRAYSISQKFPFPDKLLIRKSRAFKASEEAFYNFNKKLIDLVNKITNAYYEFVYLNNAILLMKENITLLNNFENVAQTKYKSGQVQNQDLLKVQVELNKLENDLLSLEDLRFPLVTKLNTLLNLSKDTEHSWPKDSLADIVLESKYEDVNALYSELKKNNPLLLSMSENIEKNKDDLKLAKREYYPDINVGITHIDTGYAINKSTIDSGKDPLIFMLSFNVPLWTNRINASVEAATSKLKASINSLENMENEMFADLAFLHYKLRDSFRQSNLYKNILLPKASQALNAVQYAYESGKTDFQSFIDSQRVYLNFQLTYYRHNANFNQRLSELQALLGEMKEYNNN